MFVEVISYCKSDFKNQNSKPDLLKSNFWGLDIMIWLGPDY